MATRSTIWIKEDNNINNIKGIYCHFDGYLDNNGKILFEHYQDVDKIKSLISLGSISSLAPNIEKSDNMIGDDIVVAYHRDRGEDLHIYEINSLKQLKDFFEEYNYLYDVNKSKWLVYIEEKNKFVSLKKRLKKESIII